MIYRLIVLGLCLGWVALSPQRASATLFVTVLNTSIPVSGTGTIDVMINGTGDAVTASSLKLRITPDSGADSSLRFVSSQTTNYRTDGSYLFSGVSSNVTNMTDPRTVSNFTFPQDTFTDSDSTSPTSGVNVGAPILLLARVDVESVVPLGANIADVLNDTFTVSVTGASGGTETNFTTTGGASLPFFASAGTVGLTATAVPEPSSLALASVGMVGAWVRYRKRKKV